LDFSLVSMEPRGRALLGYSEAELTNRGGYDLIHHDDLFYVASAHQECKRSRGVWMPDSINNPFSLICSAENRRLRPDRLPAGQQGLRQVAVAPDQRPVG